MSRKWGWGTQPQGPRGLTSINKAVSPKLEPAAREQVLKHKSLLETFLIRTTKDRLQKEPLPYLEEKGNHLWVV